MDTPVRKADLTYLSTLDIALMTQFGYHPHDLKDHSGRSHSDLFKDREENVYICPKRTDGEPEPTGINLRELRSRPVPESWKDRRRSKRG
jgi:hypothetical protein